MFIKRIYQAYTTCGSVYLCRKFSSRQYLKDVSYQIFKSDRCSGVTKAQRDAVTQFIKRSMSDAADPGSYNVMMKAWQLKEYGVQNISLESVQIPDLLNPSDVLVKVTAASVNPLDVILMDSGGSRMFEMLRGFGEFGGIFAQPPFPLTAGRDFVGEVVRVGETVTDIKVADKVWGVVLPQYQGCHSQYAVVNSCVVCPKPEDVSDVEAASIPFVGLTAWQAVVYTAGLRPYSCKGLNILIIGATGGLGSFLIQLLSLWGAKVTAICSEKSFDFALSLGASEVYDYNDQEMDEQLRFEQKFHYAFDAAGTNDSRWAEVLQPDIYAAYISLKLPVLAHTDEHGVILGLFKSFADLLQQNMVTLPEDRLIKWAFFFPNKKALVEIGKLLSQKQILPVIDKVYKMEEGKAAYQHMKNDTKRGKIVIDFTS